MLIADNAAPRTVVQVNTLRISAEELAERLNREHVSAKPHEWMADCLVLSGTGSLEQLPAFREGCSMCRIRRRSSAFCARDCRNPAGTCWTAAPRREARALPRPSPWAVREASSPATYTPQNCPDRKRRGASGLTNITARQQDAPSCAGVGRRHGHRHCRRALLRPGHHPEKPDIRYKNLKELEDLPAMQLKILETQASYVKPGGTLLYSTCTVLKRENEDVVSAFLAAHGEFTTEPLPLPDVFPKTKPGCSP